MSAELSRLTVLSSPQETRNENKSWFKSADAGFQSILGLSDVERAVICPNSVIKACYTSLNVGEVGLEQISRVEMHNGADDAGKTIF